MTPGGSGQLATIRRALRGRPRTVAVGALTAASLVGFPAVWWVLAAHDIPGAFNYTDFGVYWRTAGTWLDGGPIYDVEDPFGNYLYPPVYLLAFIPFAEWLPWPTAAEVWVVLTVGLLWTGLQALVLTYLPTLTWRERGAVAASLLVLLVGFHPVWYGMRLGQVSIALAAVVTIAAVAMERGTTDRRYDIASGALTAIGGTVKVFYAPIGTHLLLDRRRLVAAVTTGGVLAGLSLAVFGVAAHADYLQVLRWGEDWGTTPLHPAVGWIPGYYRPLYGFAQVDLPLTGVPLSLVVRAAIAVAILGVAVWLRGTDADREIFALGIVAVPLLGPQVSTHDFAVLLPAIVMLTAIEFERDGHPWLPVLALLLFHWQAYATLALVSLPEWVPLAGPIATAAPWLQPGLHANVALLGLAGYRALEQRPPAWLDRLVSG